MATAALALHLRDPHVAGSWGVCPTALLTGLDCPGCGGLRAVHDLTDGHLLAAASSNLLVVVLVPLALVGWLLWLVAGATGRPVPARLPAWAWLGVAAVVLAFTVARNLPGSWLAA